MATVDVKPDLFRWAIHRSGLSLDVLVKKFDKLPEWLEGIRQPTLRQLEDFARFTMTPFGTMFLSQPPVEQVPLPDFRTKSDRALARYSPNLLETIQTAQRRQDWLREWLSEDGAEALSFVGSASTAVNFKSLAQEIRQTLDLDADWSENLGTWEDALQVLRKHIERIGVIIFSNSVVGLSNHRPLDPEEFRGFVLCDRIAPVVFLNDADSKSARIFTLAHEIVHVWLGKDGVFDLAHLAPADEETERFCNRVAAEFLVPEYKLREVWHEAASSTKPFDRIAAAFKVSPLVAARRALDLDLITRSAFFQFYEQDRKKWMEQRESQRRTSTGGGDFYATQRIRLGRRFSAAIARATREGQVSYQEAFRLTGLSGKTFRTYADQTLNDVRNERE